ncbi:GDPmannose 4,6-dehydratase [Desulfurella multipotens]|uniref:GDP-mannose 4,6-dehydratase n=1 Tax=Desulfurella multipotens TaxID=79269 RepID=A0A1G6QWF2_9BACT|nr:GDP-mannose 4,6-dehydratase [Desulfurella multipotens]SDC96047.1 GDPmannose 4,6-dehydratase [Desulfurella multipotens]
MKKALITGIRGQDGAYLAKLLLEKGYKVYGADRRSGDSGNWRLKELGIEEDVEIIYMDLLELTNIRHVISKIMPDEVYNLAAQSFVGVSFEQPILTADIDAIGVLRLLETLRDIKPDTKFYQASTSEMFGKVREIPQTENTPFYPRSPYAVSKVFAHYISVNYREAYNMFTACGILFNHESELRGLEFVTRKTTYAIARIKRGLQDKLVLGNLDSKRDWGYAPEYVYGMYLMLQQDKPDDYILATGETHTIREFVEKAFEIAGFNIEWSGEGIASKGIDKKTGKVLVEVSKDFYRPSEVELLIGNPQKAKEKLGWQSNTKFDKLVQIMMEADLKRIEREFK